MYVERIGTIELKSKEGSVDTIFQIVFEGETAQHIDDIENLQSFHLGHTGKVREINTSRLKDVSDFPDIVLKGLKYLAMKINSELTIRHNRTQALVTIDTIRHAQSGILIDLISRLMREGSIKT